MTQEIANDFDDLDDLMGASPMTKKKAANNTNLDEDDFFGDGGFGFSNNDELGNF